jgi:hypothetical protein
LNSNKIEFLIVGALAVSWHGFPRYSGDVDFSSFDPQKKMRDASNPRWRNSDSVDSTSRCSI